MPPPESPRLKKTRNLLFFGLCFWFAVVIAASNQMAAQLQAKSPPSYPFGIFFIGGGPYAQDFSYNMIYFRGIQERIVPRPYRFEDQQTLIQQMLPQGQTGMSHAYSPVAFVLAQPLLLFSGRNAYLVYTILCAIVTLLLFHFYLFPRAATPLQLLALALCAVSLGSITTFAVGQSAPITTALLAAFWALLSGRSASLFRDLCIAGLFWALCLKPSVAIMPFMLLLGAMAWRPLAIGLLFLLLTWTSLAGYYGGFWTGLKDYSYLLNHFNNCDFIPFMRRPEDGVGAASSSLPFSWGRDLVLFCGLLLVILRWCRHITASEHFQGMTWTFLIFSPYLLPSENWVLWLLVVEGTFFQLRPCFPDFLKLLLLAAIFDLRAYLTFPVPIDWTLKCLLCAWILIELLRKRSWNSNELQAA